MEIRGKEVIPVNKGSVVKRGKPAIRETRAIRAIRAIRALKVKGEHQGHKVRRVKMVSVDL